MNNEKEYSKSLDEKTRDAKNRVINYLTKKWNVEIKSETENSIKIYCKDKKTDVEMFRLEMELRFSWKGFDFPYKTVTIPYRKKKSLEEDIQIFYMVLNEFGNEILITTKDNILNSNKISKDTIYTKGEEFFDVDLNKFQKGFDNLIDYIENNLETKEQPIEEELKLFLFRCNNCEVISQIRYKKGLRCPVCNSIIFN